MDGPDDRLLRARRILVVGAEGSGKTTFARAVAHARRLPCHSIDELAWQSARAAGFDLGGQFEPKYTSTEPLVQRPLPVRLTLVAELAERDSWVAEGVFVGWTEPLFARAELIMWLDHVGPFTSTRRILGRHIRSLPRNASALRQAGIIGATRGTARGTWRLGGTLRRVWRFYLSRRRFADMDDYSAITRSALGVTTSSHAGKLIRVRSREELDSWLGILRDWARMAGG